MPIKTSSGKWKWGNVERSSKKELVQTVYGIWKKNGSKGLFSDFLKGTHESLDESFNLDKTNLYFHGSFDKDIKKIDKPSIEHPFCVSQDIQYSLDYADGGDESDDSTNGVVYLVTIDEDSLKIFDFEDDSDIKKLSNKWPAKILDCFSKKHKANKGKLIDPLIVCDLLINDMDYSEDDPEITTLMNTSVLKRLEKFVGKKWKSIFEFRDDPSIKSGEYILRNLLLTDIKDLGFNGYKAHEQSGHSSDKCFILFDLDCMDRIFLKPIPFKDAVAAAEYMDKKFSKSDVDIDYKEHDAAIKEFIRSLKKTKQSLKESFDPNASKIYFHGSASKAMASGKIEPPSLERPFYVTSDIDYAIAFSGKQYGSSGSTDRKFNDPKKDGRYVYVVSLSPNAKFFDFANIESHIKDFTKYLPPMLGKIVERYIKDCKRGDIYEIGKELLYFISDVHYNYRKYENDAEKALEKINYSSGLVIQSHLTEEEYKKVIDEVVLNYKNNILNEISDKMDTIYRMSYDELHKFVHDFMGKTFFKAMKKDGYHGIITYEVDENDYGDSEMPEEVETDNSIGIWDIRGLDKITTVAINVDDLKKIYKDIESIQYAKDDVRKDVNAKIAALVNDMQKKQSTKESVEPKDKFFKVKKNGKEIGKYGLSFYDDIKAVGIGDLEVYPEFRNKGYGTKIIKDIVNRYKNDYDKIYCFVDKDNKDAIRLYKRLGKVSDEVTYSQKISDYEYKNTNGQHYVEFYNKLKESFNPDTSKIYFHGSLDKSITRLNAPSWKHPFCVTTDLEYAMDYAKEFQEMFGKTVSSSPKEGVVYAMTINNSSLKIFDFQNNSDVNKLKGKWPSVMVKAFKSNEYGNSDPLSEITDMILSYEWQEDRSKIAAFNALKKRLESELGIKISRRELENDSTLKYKLRFSFRNLLLKDIQDLGYDGYRASETQIDSTENAFVLINLKDIDKIIPYPIPYKKAEEAVEALYARMKSGEKMELDDEDYEREDRILMAFIDELKNKKKTKTNEGYEPPYTLDTIKQKYGDEVYRKLRDDPVHRFRADTGIEVIHKEPTKDEFERIVKNWDLMTPEQKKQSDEFSMKQFGNNNKNRIDLLRKEYDFEVGDKVKIRSGIRCRQSGHTGTIVRIDPPGTYDYDMHGWSSFIVKMDDPNLGTVGFQSGSIEKLDTVKEYWGKSGKYFYCNDCHKNMSKAPDDQYIMIDDDLWEYVCKHGGKKIETEEDLCRDCIEKRLGRRITLKDLGDKINLPINDEIRKMLKKKKNIKKESLNEAHEMHSYPEKLQPTIERIVKGNEDYVLDRAYFNKEGKFIWMRNSKGYFHIFKPIKLKNVKWKSFALKDMILQDDGMMKPIDIVQFENGQEGLKYLQNKYDFEVKTMSL